MLSLASLLGANNVPRRNTNRPTIPVRRFRQNLSDNWGFPKTGFEENVCVFFSQN